MSLEVVFLVQSNIIKNECKTIRLEYRTNIFTNDWKHWERNNIIIGDKNAQIGQGNVMDVVGGFELEVRNERGDRPIEVCQEIYYKFMSTYFKQPLKNYINGRVLPIPSRRLLGIRLIIKK